MKKFKVSPNLSSLFIVTFMIFGMISCSQDYQLDKSANTQLEAEGEESGFGGSEPEFSTAILPPSKMGIPVEIPENEDQESPEVVVVKKPDGNNESKPLDNSSKGSNESSSNNSSSSSEPSSSGSDAASGSSPSNSSGSGETSSQSGNSMGGSSTSSGSSSDQGSQPDNEIVNPGEEYCLVEEPKPSPTPTPVVSPSPNSDDSEDICELAKHKNKSVDKNHKILVCHHKKVDILIDINGWCHGHKKHSDDRLGSCKANALAESEDSNPTDQAPVLKYQKCVKSE